jgi:DNA-binding beta-propeller fold protein YncE
MPADLSQLEDRLRTAYSDVAATVRPEDISERAPAATSPVRRRAGARAGSRRTPALAAAAAVLLIVVTATVIPQLLQSGSRHSNGGAGAAEHSDMAYVVAQRDLLIPVNLATGTTLKPIPLGVAGGEQGVAISPDGRLVYVLTVRGQLVPVDVRTGRAARPIDVGGVSQDLLTTPNGKAAWVLEPPYGVVAVDLENRTALGLIKVHGADGFALTPNGKTLYVLGTSGKGPVTTMSSTGLVLTAIDTATNATIGTLTLTGPDLGRGWRVSQNSITMAPGGKTVYVTYESASDATSHVSRTSGSIIGVDVASNTELKPISVGRSAGSVWTGDPLDFAISPDSQTGYLAGIHSVVPVDLRTGATLPSITLPASDLDFGYDLMLSPDGQKLYMIQNVGSTVVPFDTATSTELQPIRLAGRWMLDDGVFAQGGKTLYVLSYQGGKGAVNPGRMTPIDVATGTVGKPIDFPAGLDGIVFSPWPGETWAASASFLP